MLSCSSAKHRRAIVGRAKLGLAVSFVLEVEWAKLFRGLDAETNFRSRSMDAVSVKGASNVDRKRRFTSPQRVTIRSLSMSRDRLREKYRVVQAKLEQTRQLAAERSVSRDRWKQDCQIAQARAEAAEALVQKQQHELDALRQRCEQLEAHVATQKK